ncbi:MAG: hypothetical protein HYT64_02675 [Candidatus Yanofskybacteria bacterium]|nr:hypothetical protein [Candidatus Yanofskybacteria bacterium]
MSEKLPNQISRPENNPEIQASLRKSEWKKLIDFLEELYTQYDFENMSSEARGVRKLIEKIQAVSK